MNNLILGWLSNSFYGTKGNTNMFNTPIDFISYSYLSSFIDATQPISGVKAKAATKFIIYW